MSLNNVAFSKNQRRRENEIYSFTIELEGEGIELGSMIYAPNGREGIVEEIDSIIFKTNTKIEIKGQAKLFPVNQ